MIKKLPEVGIVVGWKWGFDGGIAVGFSETAKVGGKCGSQDGFIVGTWVKIIDAIGYFEGNSLGINDVGACDRILVSWACGVNEGWFVIGGWEGETEGWKWGQGDAFLLETSLYSVPITLQKILEYWLFTS